jgi:hypothetical protein
VPSIRHEGLLLLLRARPEIVLDLLAGAKAANDRPDPDGVTLRLEAADFTQAVPR